MNCEDVRAELEAFVEGFSSDPQAIREHVSNCRSCRIRWRALREEQETLREALALPASARPRRRSLWIGWAAAIALAVAWAASHKQEDSAPLRAQAREHERRIADLQDQFKRLEFENSLLKYELGQDRQARNVSLWPVH